MATALEAFAGAAGSGALGALGGLLASGLNRVVGIWEMKEKRKDRQLEIAHEEKSWGHETALLELQQKGQREETEDELRLRDAALAEFAEKGSWEGLTASIQAQAALAGKSWPWVDAVNALVRPGLTLLLFTGQMIAFGAAAFGMLGDQGEPVTARVVDTLSFAANVALLFWFGERAQRVQARG